MTLSAYTLSPQWAFNRWLVVLLVLVAGALVVYLYRAQQKVASRRAIVSLTAIRLLLVLLMFALLAGLSVRWTRTGSSRAWRRCGRRRTTCAR
jgi:nitrogen fixation/metabolism regulation signal transduction histidine kinase